MISILSIGISDYSCKTENIQCATKDAKNFFEVARHTFKDSFNHFNSICLENVSAFVFESFLKCYLKSIEKSDTLILYFSGHGEVKDDVFQFVFRDDSISQISLVEILKRSEGHTVVVVDACYSGVGLSMTNSTSAIKKSKISVIAATQKISTAKFNNEGSEFTQALCDTIIRLTKKSSKISLKDISDDLESKKVQCLINIEEGNSDVVLFDAQVESVFDEEFTDRTLGKLLDSNTTTKEMLWYSILDLPPSIKYKIAQNYIKYSSEKKNEASWRVRKAIGNFINSCSLDTTILLPMLNSGNWMEQCIALNALKYNITDEISRHIKKIVINEDKPMCLVWLAHLYLTDSDFIDLETSLKSNLMQTDWGILDIYKRIKSSEEKKCFRKKLKTNNIGNNIAFDDITNNIKLKETRIYKFIKDYEGETKRGRLGSDKTDKKWLFSIINGYWRDHSNIDLNEYFENTNEEIVKKELSLCYHFSEVETRMLILTYFENNKTNFSLYQDSLKWGLRDSHPWIKNIAIKLFPELIRELGLKQIDTLKYPGYMDLLLTLKELNCDIENATSRLNKNERNALE